MKKARRKVRQAFTLYSIYLFVYFKKDMAASLTTL